MGEIAMPFRDIVVIGSVGGRDRGPAGIGPPASPGFTGGGAGHGASSGQGAERPARDPRAAAPRLPTHPPAEGETIRPGQIYVAPPDRHLVIKGDRMHLTRGPRQNGFRPSIDVMFRTAARAYGPRVIGVVLSGAWMTAPSACWRSSGMAGWPSSRTRPRPRIRACHKAPIENVPIDRVARTADLGAILNDLTRQIIPEAAATSGGEPMSDPNADPNSELYIDPRSYADSIRDIAETARDGLNNGPMPGVPAQLTCPDCGGVLWEVRDGDLYRYICHVGHNFSPEGMVEFQNDGVELALWTALRALEESVSLRERMAQRAGNRDARIAARYHQQAAEARRQAQVLRRCCSMATTPLPPGHLPELMYNWPPRRNRE